MWYYIAFWFTARVCCNNRALCVLPCVTKTYTCKQLSTTPVTSILIFVLVTHLGFQSRSILPYLCHGYVIRRPLRSRATHAAVKRLSHASHIVYNRWPYADDSMQTVVKACHTSNILLHATVSLWSVPCNSFACRKSYHIMNYCKVSSSMAKYLDMIWYYCSAVLYGIA